MGGLGLAELRAAYRCCLVGCRLTWLDDFYPEGPPLMCWANVTEQRVVVLCRSCGAEHLREVAEFCVALHRAGVADGNISYRRLGGHLIRGPCRACGARLWHVYMRPDPGPKIETFGMADLA